MQMIANTIPLEPVLFIGVFGVLSFILTAVTQVVTLIRGRNPQPFKVEAAIKYASTDDLRKVDEKVEALQREARTDIAALSKALMESHNKIMTSQAEGRRRLYEKIDDVSNAIHAVELKVTAIAAREETKKAEPSL